VCDSGNNVIVVGNAVVVAAGAVDEAVVECVASVVVDAIVVHLPIGAVDDENGWHERNVKTMRMMTRNEMTIDSLSQCC
jgi:hypothetical protein